jgi:hypothetical protein
MCNSPGGSWITGMGTVMGIIGNTAQTQSAYHPMIKQTMYNGDIVCIGGLGTTFGYQVFKAGRVVNGVDYQFVIDTANGLVSNSGAISASQVYNAVYNDYAEFFEKNEEVEEVVEPGDVVIRSSNGEWYAKSTKAYEKTVVGVCSDEYAQCIGGPEGDLDERKKATIAVGLAGRLHVKVTGKVRVGDLLVASHIKGVAMSEGDTHIPGTVIGKALENHDGDSVDRVRMIIMNA